MKHANKNLQDSLAWNSQLIKKYDQSGPKYTSYLTALLINMFVTIAQFQF